MVLPTTPPRGSTSGRRAMRTPPNIKIAPTTPQQPKTSPTIRSPRTPENSLWVNEEKRRNFMSHLKKWSENHDSCLHFQGSLTVEWPVNTAKRFELGDSIRCILTQDAGSVSDCRKLVIIRLYEPAKAGSPYRMLVRYGSGWVSAREFFSREYFSRLKADPTLKTPGRHKVFQYLDKSKFDALGPKPRDQSTVTIQPLFHKFLHLPVELQQEILGWAVHKLDMYRPCADRGFSTYNCKPFFGYRTFQSSTKITDIMLISKSINKSLVPWIYKTTNFHFKTSGFTNFMWLCGPSKRPYIKKIILAFGHYGVLHPLRWMAPDSIFEFFEPPLCSPGDGLQYLWRVQIRDYTAELELSTLTIDIYDLPVKDIPLLTRLLRCSFKSVDKIQFTESGKLLSPDDPRIVAVSQPQTWKSLCREALERHRRSPEASQYMSYQRRYSTDEQVNAFFEERKDFFDIEEMAVKGMGAQQDLPLGGAVSRGLKGP